MGYKLQKRLDLLKDHTEADRHGRLGFFKAFFLSLLALWFIAHIFDEPWEAPQGEAGYPGKQSHELSGSEIWEAHTKQQINSRAEWLEDSWAGMSAARTYRRFAKNLYEVFIGEPLAIKEGEAPPGILDLDSWLMSLSHRFTGFFLRLGFLLIAAWPLWLLGTLGGFAVFKFLLIPKKTDDVLGVLTRGSGPFYSGIYGPLVSNSSASGTDLSAPNLACPALAPKNQALNHALVNTLKEYSALNDTNFELVRVILVYSDLPSVVDEERLLEDEADAAHDQSLASVRTNEEGTIEKSSLEGLAAVLSAHKALIQLSRSAENAAFGEAQFGAFVQAREAACKNFRPLARNLAMSLTPARVKALITLSPQAVASAYLATEAGKSLVYKRDGKAYVQISRFPHLQARAVLQSAVSYHREYKGDTRMVMRQAIICSRRHGDFGRTFLPVNMPIISRALRDWLEILYAAPKRREEIAHLVELDTHIEEISAHWRKELSRQLERESMSGKTSLASNLWRGISFKSVVLVPLRDLVGQALHGIAQERLDRISELLKLTRRLQASLSISARLPGFKRQATEAEKGGMDSGGVTKLLAENPGDAKLLEGWIILRRLLTKYNWLSTRVGDDAVPEDGLVQAIVIDHSGEKLGVVPLEALVPLRQRRYRELLGQQWESLYYAHSPHEDDVEIFIDDEEFRKQCQERKEQLEKGTLPAPPAKTFSAEST